MTPTPDARKHPWHDPGLVCSNPVYVADRLLAGLSPWFRQDRLAGTAEGPTRFSRCLENLARLGGRLPGAVVERYRLGNCLPADFRLHPSMERPGVLGLAVDPESGDGFVLPLRPERLGFGGWVVARSLPFPEDDVQELLAALMFAGVPDARAIPERLAYRFENPLNRKVRGNSMTVAATLAVLDSLGGGMSEPFRAAIALVEPGVNGALEEVDHIPAKLRGALREHDRLSLVVVRRGTALPHGIDRERIDRVWAVRTVGDLATELAAAGLLAPLIEAGTAPLGASELVRVRNRLQWLTDHEHKYAEAANLTERVRHCAKRPPLDPGTLTEIGRLSAAACRHHGRFTRAVDLGREVHDEVRRLGDAASADEEADAAAEYAAALFDSHDFRAIPPLLEHWASEAADRPRCFRVLTRIKVWNTLGRARAILGPTGWDELFRRSLALSRSLGDTANLQRTSSYLVHGLLRHDRVTEAVTELAAAGASRDPLPSANPWVGFPVANAARAEGAQWGHPELDKARPDDDKAVPRHAYGFYYQATGRQQPRAVDGDLGRIERLTRAAAFFRAEAGDAERNICGLFAEALELAAAALAPDAFQWADSVRRIRSFLDHADAAPLQEYYRPAVEALPAEPCPASAERLLRLIPYF